MTCRILIPLITLSCFFLVTESLAAPAEWWERPWDCKVAPNPDKKKRWYLECVNDLGGTPEKDNQRDIAKSLGRIRKFHEQTVFRALESRDMSEVAAMGKGPMGRAISEATPRFGEAEKLIQAAIPLQKEGRFEDARARIDGALKLLVEDETTMEIAIAIRAERRHLQHLRNAALHAGLKLERKIRKLGKRVEKEVRRRTENLEDAVAEQQTDIDILRQALAANPAWKEASSAEPAKPTQEQLTGAEFRHSLDTYQYLLNAAAKSGDRAEVYQGDTFLRDAQVSDLQLGAVSSVARRVSQLRFKLRQLSNRMSAAAGKPMTDSLNDELSAKLGSPIDDLDHFTRSKFGWVKSNRLIGNSPWNWEFNYTPPGADAICLAGRWEFQIDPKFVGENEQWFRADHDTTGWRNIYAPNWWEREGVTDYNPIDNLFPVHKQIMGREYPKTGRGATHADHRQYNGVAWYRKSVYIPEHWQGAVVKLRGGVMNGSFRFHVNGTLTDEKWQRSWWGLRDLTLAAQAIKFGAVNELTVCCYSDSSVGGLAEEPLWLMKENGKAEFRRTPLSGGYASEETYGSPRGEVRINLLTSAMSPGAILASDSARLHLWGWSMKGYAVPESAAFATEAGVQWVTLDAARTVVAGSDLKENWVLLNVGQGYGDPLLLVFEHRPTRILWQNDPLREGLEIEFPKTVGQVGMVHPGANGTPAAELAKSARFWSRAMLAYPEHASEFWKVDPSSKNLPFEVMGTFDLVYNYHRVEDDWKTEPLEIAGLPILSCLALDYGYPGFTEPDVEKVGPLCRYQAYAKAAFRAKANTNQLTYAAPCADHSTLWKGIGTFTKFEVSKVTRAGRKPRKHWVVSETKKWGSNNNRLALHLWSRLQGGKEQWWDLGFQKGFDGELLPPDHENWKQFDQIVQDHVDNDLFLILDGFPDDQTVRPGDDTTPQTGRWMRLHPNAIPSQVKLWKTIAERYRQVSPRHFGYNFYNEPAYIDPKMYNKAIQAITAGIREVEKEKWITIDMGDGWAQPNWMFGTEPTGDPKTAYQYHFYYFHDGIVQGHAPEALYPQWLNDKPFFFMNSKETFIEELLDTFVYQTVHHVPVWCGEFGGSINNPNQECLIWLEDHLQLMERMGHGWSWWNWDGDGYGRTGLRDGDLVSPTVLLLKQYMHRKGAF